MFWPAAIVSPWHVEKAINTAGALIDQIDSAKVFAFIASQWNEKPSMGRCCRISSSNFVKREPMLAPKNVDIIFTSIYLIKPFFHPSAVCPCVCVCGNIGCIQGICNSDTSIEHDTAIELQA